MCRFGFGPWCHTLCSHILVLLRVLVVQHTLCSHILGLLRVLAISQGMCVGIYSVASTLGTDWALILKSY